MNIAEYNADSLRIALDTICRIGDMCGGTQDVFYAVQRVLDERNALRALITEYFAAKDARVAEDEQYCTHDVREPYDYAANLQRVLQIGRRTRAAEAALRAVVAS